MHLSRLLLFFSFIICLPIMLQLSYSKLPSGMFKFKCFFNLSEARISHVFPAPASEPACCGLVIRMERYLSTKTFPQSMAGFAS